MSMVLALHGRGCGGGTVRVTGPCHEGGGVSINGRCDAGGGGCQRSGRVGGQGRCVIKVRVAKVMLSTNGRCDERNDERQRSLSAKKWMGNGVRVCVC